MTYTISNWQVVKIPDDPRVYIQGEVLGHPDFTNGVSITTSALKNYELIDGSNDFFVITNSNSKYRLTEPLKSQTFIKQRLIRYLDAVNTTLEDVFKTGLTKDLAKLVDEEFKE